MKSSVLRGWFGRTYKTTLTMCAHLPETYTITVPKRTIQESIVARLRAQGHACTTSTRGMGRAATPIVFCVHASIHKTRVDDRYACPGRDWKK